MYYSDEIMQYWSYEMIVKDNYCYYHDHYILI